MIQSVPPEIVLHSTRTSRTACSLVSGQFDDEEFKSEIIWFIGAQLRDIEQLFDANKSGKVGVKGKSRPAARSVGVLCPARAICFWHSSAVTRSIVSLVWTAQAFTGTTQKEPLVWSRTALLGAPKMSGPGPESVQYPTLAAAFLWARTRALR